MKKLTLSLLASALAFIGVAQADQNADLARNIALTHLKHSRLAANVINWKIGEFTQYNLNAMGMQLGTMEKTATSEEGNGVWVTQKISGQMIGNQTVETLMDRGTGQVLKVKQNGQETQVPDQKLEIVDQDTTTITVPAGTFEVVHVKAKTQSAGNVEIWANPRDITLDGTAKMTIEASGVPITLELTKFGGR